MKLFCIAIAVACTSMINAQDRFAAPDVSDGLLTSTFNDSAIVSGIDQLGLKLSGWSDISFTPSNRNGDLLPFGFNYRGNQFQLQQNWIRLDWTSDANQNKPSFGVHTDVIVPGTDYRFTVARGLYDKQLTDDGGAPIQYGIDPVQLYAKIDIPSIGDGYELKIGRFYTLIGAESIDATRNYLGSRSFALVKNPLTQTGALATLKISDYLSISSGLVTGNDIFFDSPESLYYTGNITCKSKDGQSTFSFSTILGKGEYDIQHSFQNPQVFDLVVSHKLSDTITFTFEALYGFTNFQSLGGYADWYSFVNYIDILLTDSVSTTTRLEFFTDDQGQRTGFPGLYTAITQGVSISPYSWLTLRPEVRYDHQNDKPFNNRANLFTATFDAIIRW